MPPTSYSTSTQNVWRFGRTWWWEQVRTLFWVILVTVLIWVYADMEFTQTRDLVVNVHLVINPTSDLAVLGRQDFTVSARAQGNRSSLDAFEHYLKANGDRLEIDVSTFNAGDNELSAEELIRHSPELAKAGLTTSVPNADRIKFQLERMVVKDVPVRPGAFSGGQLSGEPVINTPSVKIRLPSSQWDQIEAEARAKGSPPVLLTEPVSLERLVSGKPQHIRVPLAGKIGDVPVQPVPAGVTMDLQVERAVRTKSLKVPVQVIVSPAWVTGEANFWRKYRLKQEYPPEWRPTLNIVGPAKDLEALQARQDEIHAFTELTEDDVMPPTGSYKQHTVIVLFPPDLDVKLQGAPPMVQLRLEKISD